MTELPAAPEGRFALPVEDLEHVLEHTEPLWRALDGERLFLTGGTGFVGKWLLETLLHARARMQIDVGVTVLTRNAGRFAATASHLHSSPAVTLLEGDVRDFAFPTDRHAFVVHAATDVVNVESHLDVFDTCVTGTRRVLDFASARQTQAILMVSSGAVYGRQDPGARGVSEDQLGQVNPADPRAGYALGKLASEWLAHEQAARTSLDVKVARCFAFVGPYLALDQHFAIGNFIRDALDHRQIVIKGDGTPVRSYLYAADMAIWLWRILLDSPRGATYNVGSGEGLPLGDVATIVSNTLKVNEPPLIMTPPKEGVAAERYLPNVEKIAEQLQLRPTISLEEAIRRTAAWHQNRTTSL